MMAMRYDKQTNYQKKINEAKAAGDNTAASVYEQQRNAKIAGEGLGGVSATSNYAKYLPDQGVIDSIVNAANRAPLPAAGGNAQLTANTAAVGARGFSNPYADQIDQLAGSLGKPFSYTQEEDPAAAAMRENFTRNGQRAMQDTLAQVSARTGGLASSYAGTAAQQSYDGYMENLNAELAGLRQQAFENHMAEQNLVQNQLGTLSQLGSQAQSSYYDAIGAAMNRWQSLGLADAEVARALGVAVGTPTTDQSYQLWSQNFQKQQADAAQSKEDRNRAYQTAMAMLQQGKMPTDTLLEAAGIARADAQMMAWKQPKAGGYGGGGQNGQEYASELGEDEPFPEGAAYLAENPEVAVLNDVDTSLPINFKRGDNGRSGGTVETGLPVSFSYGENGRPMAAVNPNKPGGDGVMIPGIGRVSWEQLEQLVLQRKVTERQNAATGEYTYQLR